MNGWTIEILRKSDAEPKTYDSPEHLPLVPGVGDKIPWDVAGGPKWAQIVERRFQWSENGSVGIIQLLVEPVEE